MRALRPPPNQHRDQGPVDIVLVLVLQVLQLGPIEAEMVADVEETGGWNQPGDLPDEVVGDFVRWATSD